LVLEQNFRAFAALREMLFWNYSDFSNSKSSILLRVFASERALSMPKEPSTYQRIWETVKQIPKGKIESYADVASLTGLPGQQRLVGYALHNLPHNSGVPWQRVINAQGKISFPPKTAKYKKQKMLLEKEGVVFEKGKVDMEKFGVMRWLERM
jgi:methylated-DNA-protein-cysteine methyltransferase-like protein